MDRFARGARRCSTLACLGALALSAWILPLAAQPVHWSHRWPSPTGYLVADPVGHFYVARRDYIDKLDAAGRVLWTVPRGALCVTCSPIAGISAADAGSVYYVMDFIGRPMQCAIGCNQASVYRQPGDGGGAGLLYGTPLTAPPTASLGVTAGSNGEVVVFGRDATGGLLVRLQPTPLELRHGTALGPVVVTTAGAMVVSGRDGATGFVRRYDAAGGIAWTTATAACSRLAAHPVGGVACLVLPSSSTRGSVDLFDPQGVPVRRGLADDVAAIAFDASGALWTAGVACSGSCASLRKFTPTGALVAESVLDEPGHTSEWRALAIAPDGEVYTTGLVRPLPAPMFMPSDMLTARHDGSARRLWQARVNGALDWNDAGLDIAATADGAIALGTLTDTGLYAGTQPDTLLAIKYGRNALVSPLLVLSATPNPARAGEPLTLAATVSGTLAPSGTVTFSLGSATACAAVPLIASGATSAVARCTTAAPAGGTHVVGARYDGDANFSSTSAAIALTVADAAAAVPTLAPALLALLAMVLVVVGWRAVNGRVS